MSGFWFRSSLCFGLARKVFLAASPLVGTDQENESERWLTSKENPINLICFRPSVSVVHGASSGSRTFPG